MKPTSQLQALLPRLWHHFGVRRRSQFMTLLGLMMASVFAEIVSLGAVVPFIGILAAPDSMLQFRVVRKVADWLGVASPAELVMR